MGSEEHELGCADRRARALASAERLDMGSLHYLRDVKRRRVHPEDFERLRAARWRLKNGLEHRALVALLHAPEVLQEARERLRPTDFLTPAYAALAAVLLAPQAAGALEVAYSAIASRPYIPDPEHFDWKSEARESVTLLLERRERWARSRHLSGSSRPSAETHTHAAR